MKMMELLELVDDDFTLQNAMQCYIWSRMSTIDEVKDYTKFESLTFVDLLEALGQVADHKHLPLASDLQEAGINSLQWAVAKAAGVEPLLWHGRAQCVHKQPSVSFRLSLPHITTAQHTACPERSASNAHVVMFVLLQATRAPPPPCQTCTRTRKHASAGRWWLSWRFCWTSCSERLCTTRPTHLTQTGQQTA
jgi:hypothetical protein